MISVKNRFHGYSSLKYVYQKGQIVRGPLFSVKYAVNPKRKTFRVAVVVSKKVHKSAVLRNRIRRRIYEIVRLNAESIKQPFDIVISVYHDSVAIEPTEVIAKQLLRQLKSAGIIETK